MRDHGGMVERREIPRAYAGSSAGDRSAIPRAVRWLSEQLESVGGQPLLYVPGRQHLNADTTLEQLARRIATATWRAQPRGGWSGGPVIAAWPDRRHLAEIDDDARTAALCVIDWSEQDTAAWLAAFSPTLLAGQTTPTIASRIDDPVVAEGLKTLTAMVNHANNLSGAMDKRDAIDVLQRLHDGGHHVDPEAIYAWSLENGWNARGAERLREFSARISQGMRPRKGMSSALRSDILTVWRDAAADGGEPAWSSF